jgi:hypothetical protein
LADDRFNRTARMPYGRVRVETLLILLAIILFAAALIVLVVALRRPKKPDRAAARQDPLTFGEMPRFGPRQLGPGAIVAHGGIDYVVRGSVTLRQGPFVWSGLLTRSPCPVGNFVV